eukprot:TRINITY_DN1547_c1_g2_i3.p1 TRINITY_DN1547_c1_g2~~TRINITY_DN1547_c1_g2_i3.p1  ORF type:complete len:1540 (+),score=281.18 TRINITY_DN1547_c1_g2_i3:135-4754(+)
MLGIRCLTVALSLALVVITGGIIGGLSISTGNRVTEETKDTGQSGLETTITECDQGLARLKSVQDAGLDHCFASGNHNSEELGYLFLDQVVEVVKSEMHRILDVPRTLVEQVFTSIATLPPEDLNDQRNWDERYSRWLFHAFLAARSRGVNRLRVEYFPGTHTDGVPHFRKRQYVEHPFTVGKPEDGETYHHLLMLSDAPMKCYEGNTYTRAVCEVNSCVWCIHNFGGAGYCGDPRRFSTSPNGQTSWAPCRAGYSSTVVGPTPWYANMERREALGTTGADGVQHVGSCGAFARDKCGCFAHSDVLVKRTRATPEERAVGWPLGRPPRPGTQEPYQAFPIVGRYRRLNGSFPNIRAEPRTTVLEPNLCVVSEWRHSDLDGHQRGKPLAVGKERWTPVGAGVPIPLMPLSVYRTWTHRSVPLRNGLPQVTGLVSSGISVLAFTSFMRQIVTELPDESRLYAVQQNPWTTTHPCADDFHGLLTLHALTCAGLVAQGRQCSDDLSQVSSRLNARNPIWWHCPVTCGRCPWKLREKVGTLVGVSHGEAKFDIPLNESRFGHNKVHDLLPLHVLESTDSVTREHANWTLQQPGHYGGLAQTRGVQDWIDNTGTLWWMKVDTVTMNTARFMDNQPDEDPLKIFLVILVKRNQALKEIDASTHVVRTNITKQTTEVQTTINQSRSDTAKRINQDYEDTEDHKQRLLTLMYIIVAVSAALLIVAGAGLAVTISKPIGDLARKMEQVAGMKLEGIDEQEQLSSLSEIRNMQLSFLQMVANLKEYRSYMPQTLLVDSEFESQPDMDDGDNMKGSAPLSPKAGLLDRSFHGTSPSPGANWNSSTADVASRTALGATRRHHSATLMLASMEAPGGTAPLVASFAAAVLDVASRYNGVPVSLSTLDSNCQVTISWNVHRRCVTHCCNACGAAVHASNRAATLLFEQVGGFDGLSVAVGVATGSLDCANVGGDNFRVPVVLGAPVTDVQALCAIAHQNRVGAVTDEQVFAKVRTDVPARVMDAILSPTRAKELVVYELLESWESVPGDGYTMAFSAMRQGKWLEARHAFAAHLKGLGPDQAKDVQVLRLLATAAHFTTLKQAPSEYIRRPYRGRFEPYDSEELSQNEELPEDVRDLLTGHAPMSTKTPLTQPPTSPLRQVTTAVSISADDTVHLQKQIEDLISLHSQGSATLGGVVNSFKDARGRRYHRSSTQLGKGAFGEVWLGMGDDGSMVAVKSLNLRSLRRGTQEPAVIRASESQIEALGQVVSTWQTAADTGWATMDFNVLAGIGSSHSETGSPTTPYSNVAATLDAAAATRRQVAEMVQEINLMIQLQHENVVQYLGCAVEGSHVLIVMEYIPGGTLQGIARQFGGSIPPRAVPRFISDIIRGLEFIHGKGIVHRDLKPANVLVTVDGQARLADFGASAELAAAAHKKQKAEDDKKGVFTLVGTPLYMAPEQAMDGAVAASDLWALGVLLLELLTGEPPWPPAEFAEPMTFIWKLAQNSDFVPLISDGVPALPANLARQCLQRDPTLRPSAYHLLNDPYVLSSGKQE